MRVLNQSDIEEVSGGLGPVGFTLGVFGGAARGIRSGYGWQGVLVSATLGGAIGATEGLAAVAFRGGQIFTGGAWSIRPVGLTAVSGGTGGGSSPGSGGSSASPLEARDS